MATLNVFSDLDISFKKNIYDDVSKKIDVNAVKQAVRDVVLTQKGEKLFNPEYGTRIYGLLFEPVDDDFMNVLITDDVEEAIKIFEPRVKNVNVEVRSSLENNTVDIIVNFSIENFSEIYIIKEIIERIR